MDKVRLGLIGFGTWARDAYMPVLLDSALADVVAISARSEETFAFAREQYGDQIAQHTDMDELLADESIDAVMLALPNLMHASALEAAIAAGKHAFFEPPIGYNEAEIRRAFAAAKASGLILQTDLELRYTPVMQLVAEKAASGELGDSLMATCRLWCSWGHGGGEWQEAAEAQGFFLWLGCWYLDVLDQVFGAAPLRASVMPGRAMNGTLMDHGWATLEYPNGLGQFEMSMVAPEEQEVSVRVTGTAAEIEADLWSGEWRLRRTGEEWTEGVAACAQPIHGFSGIRESVLSFLECVRSGATPVANLEVSARVHAAALACMKSERSAETISVELI